MIGYRRRKFSQAYSLLRQLGEDLADIDSLRELQQLLLKEIARAETQVRNLKIELRRISESIEGTAEKKKLYIQRRIDAFRQCAYIWRCFGDGIAYIYMDKHAIKHVYYQTGAPRVRQNAGFIIGKTGLSKEILLLESALAKSIPALLTDLTNTLRHGDVCLMTGPDPHLIEVKASRGLDKRGREQKRNLEKLHAFFEHDHAEWFRGFAEVTRVVYEFPEINYIFQLNECIAEAYDKGFAVRQPEAGVFYVVLAKAGLALDDILSSINPEKPWIFLLNELKATRSWSPYQPFVLTIERESDLWAFIRGEIYIVVLVDTVVLCTAAADLGYQVCFDVDDTDYPLHIHMPGVEGGRISAQLLGRIAMECVSPKWLIGAVVNQAQKAMELHLISDKD